MKRYQSLICSLTNKRQILIQHFNNVQIIPHHQKMINFTRSTDTLTYHWELKIFIKYELMLMRIVAKILTGQMIKSGTILAFVEDSNTYKQNFKREYFRIA